MRRRRKKSKQRHEIHIRTLIPNLVTMLAAASGVTSIRFSCQGKWQHATVAIIIAAVLDGLDGRLARLLKSTSKLGAELDSLADFVSFGVAPAIFIYFWVMERVEVDSFAYSLRGVFWGFALFYALCGAFRLARFNTMLDSGPTQPYWRHYFMGIPAPGGASLIITAPVWQIHTGLEFWQSPWIGCSSLVICGLLMASRFPTISFKNIRIPAKRLVPSLLVVMFVLAMLVAQFWMTLAVVGLLYYLSIPVAGIIFARLRKRHEARQA